MGLERFLQGCSHGVRGLVVAAALLIPNATDAPTVRSNRLFAADLTAAETPGLPSIPEPERPVVLEDGFRPTMSNRYRVENLRHRRPPHHSVRPETDYIIVHWTEDDFAPLYVKRNHLANYLIDRGGVVFRIVPHQYNAHHAGTRRRGDREERSLWDGERDLDRISVGIEVVSRGPNGFTEDQWRSLRWLVNELKDIYGLTDEAVLGHYEVANPRGRKVDPACLPWRDRLGIETRYDSLGFRYDPDVLAGRTERSFDLELMERFRLCSKDELAAWNQKYLPALAVGADSTAGVARLIAAARLPAAGYLSEGSR